MITLPSSIETYLSEAGFTGSEIVVLRKLLEERSLTVRELASKTGKSTGVLDQAMKKLLKKDIVVRETINETPKYSLLSLQPVLQWMQKDMEKKQDMIRRKHQNFESFLRSVEVQKQRPEMEFFEGEEGVKQAYMRLLEYGHAPLQYGPTLWSAEEDPLRDFRVAYFRERRSRNIFTRVITHNTPLGRRSHSRDPFEFRKTVLVDEEMYPFSVEKIIVGDTVACFYPAEQRACFVHFPDLAHDERVFFESMWNAHLERSGGSAAAIDRAVKEPEELPHVPLRTRMLSHLREIILRPSALIAALVLFVGGLALTAAAGIVHDRYAVNALEQQAFSIASTSVLQFDVNNLVWLSITRPTSQELLESVQYKLNNIRNRNEGVLGVSIVRLHPDDEDMAVKVADADGLLTLEDGGAKNVFSASEFPQLFRAFADAKATYHLTAGFFQRNAAFDLYFPIQSAVGNRAVVAVLHMQMDARRVHALDSLQLWMVVSLLILLLVFLIVRMTAFNRSLYQELVEAMQRHGKLIMLILNLILSLFIAFFVWYFVTAKNIGLARENILTIAKTAAIQFSAEDLEKLRVLKDIEKPEYEYAVKRLSQIREKNRGIKYVYLIRPHANTTKFEFIADADAYGMDFHSNTDINMDGIIDGSDDYGYPGLTYDISHIAELRYSAYSTPFVTKRPYADKWGKVYSAYSPIMDEHGRVAAIIAVDSDASLLAASIYYFMTPFLFLSSLVVIILYKRGLLNILFMLKYRGKHEKS